MGKVVEIKLMNVDMDELFLVASRQLESQMILRRVFN
jgi:hypothetical protein